MLERLRLRLRKRNAPPPRARREPAAAERASGEDAWRTQDELAREATTPGTPRLKADKL
jgi:hypothetical protein